MSKFMRLIAGKFEFQFPRSALVMGIVNVTPDSFSDGGKFLKPAAAIEHGLRLAREGADILDIGGESTRPRATPVSEEEELQRVLPVIRELAPQVKVPISIDTMKPAVARAALDAGASIVNDVGANRTDSEMWRVVAQSRAGYVCMHMQGTPQAMQEQPKYKEGVVPEVAKFFLERMLKLVEVGLNRDQVILDVGIGFGKTAEQNLELLAAIGRFKTLERPVLLGVSRKSFVEKVSGTESASSLPGSLACACLAVEAGVQILRVHDVAETIQVVRMTEAILSKRH